MAVNGYAAAQDVADLKTSTAALAVAMGNRVNVTEAALVPIAAAVADLPDQFEAVDNELATKLVATENLADLVSASEGRTNLGLTIGTNVQAYDADLTAIAALTSAANKVPYATGAQTWAMTDLTAAGRTVIGGASTNAIAESLLVRPEPLSQASGVDVLEAVTTGVRNTGFGFEALKANTGGSENTAFGYLALNDVTGGVDPAANYNTAFGSFALASVTTGYKNTSIGRATGDNLTTGYHDTALGYGAMHWHTTALNCVGVGFEALHGGTGVVATAMQGTIAVGFQSLYNCTGDYNIAVGTSAGLNISTGVRNVAVGTNALNAQTTANDTTAIGYAAGTTNTGSGNIFIGQGADANAGRSNVTVIGTGLTVTTNNTILMGNGQDLLPGSTARDIGSQAKPWNYMIGSNSFYAHCNTAMPAGGANGKGFLLSSTGNFGVFFGSGAPTLSAARGSLYLRSDGSDGSNRLYINSDNGTGWVAVPSDVAASGGSALVGFLQSGTSATARTVQAKLRDIINVKDFGATGDGTTDDAAAIRAAITAASGRTLYFPTPSASYLCNSSLGTLSSVRLLGDGRRVCTIKKNYSGGSPFITMNDSSELEGLRIDLAGNTGVTGLGIYIANSQGNQRIAACQLLNGDTSCLYFQKDGGSNFTAYDLQAYCFTASNPAVEIEDVSTGGCPRSFVNFSSGGNKSFKLGGANNLFVSNSPIFDVDFSANNYDVCFSNCRMAGSSGYTVRGSGSIMGGGIGPDMTVASGAAWNINPAYTNSTITDNSGGTSIIHLHNIVAYTPVWTAGGSAVTLGTGGSIIGRYSRSGKLVTANFRILPGTGPTIPAGQWAVTLPVPTAADLLQPAGTGKYTTGGGAMYRINGIVNAAGSTVLLERDTSGNITSTSPSATGDGAGVWFQITYAT